jgi:hypothetical protein
MTAGLTSQKASLRSDLLLSVAAATGAAASVAMACAGADVTG